MERIFEIIVISILIIIIFKGIIKKVDKKGSKKSTYKDYLKSEHWMVTRKAALRRANYRCQLCGSTKFLQVHHNNYKNLGHEKDTDLIVLCKYCHGRHHKKI